MPTNRADAAFPCGPPPVYHFKGNMEYAAPGLTTWSKEAWARLERLREDFEVLRKWASEQRADNFFAEQVMYHAEARLEEWNRPVERWEP